MKVVLDANVLVAAFATQGLCHAVFELCLDQQQIVLSETILSEVCRALDAKLKVPAEAVERIQQYLRENASVLDVPRPYERISRDPSDDHVLALLLQSKSDYLITGDQHLLMLKTHGKALIVQPRQFWEILKVKGTESQP